MLGRVGLMKLTKLRMSCFYVGGVRFKVSGLRFEGYG